ncbi:MAG: type II toxin-antitoxin system HicB family antitoxin, partial [Planctomycetota bacterium]|nr:type II toxin-antitoxin system HicB family antitoxin [Planctomycetota bacterium]
MMEYKGYVGKVEFDDEAGIFHGEVLDTRDVITFQGQSVAELKTAFQESIDDYLAFGTSTGIARGFGPGVTHRRGLGRCGRRVTHSSAQLFFCGDRGGPCCCP